MADISQLRDQIIFLMSKSEQSVKQALQDKAFLKLFNDDPVTERAATECVKYYEKYKQIPSLRLIIDGIVNQPNGPRIQTKLMEIDAMGLRKDQPTENEFPALLDGLKKAWIRETLSKRMLEFPSKKLEQITDIVKMSEELKSFGNSLIKISDEVSMSNDGDYSYTTSTIDSNIDSLIKKDTSSIRHFKIGHKPFDDPSGGLRYGDLLMILGNINVGKSMVVANIVYNLWDNGANVLLLTAEMQPREFDERIYSRATNVDYTNIIKGELNDLDKSALLEYATKVKLKTNQVITKFLRTSDNVGTVEGYMDDLKLKHDFVPDVIVVDSLEHISPLYINTEDKDNLKVAQIITEFKDFAQACICNRGVAVVSTHQAKTDTFDKEWEDISVTDFGRSKVAAEKPDFAFYIRTKQDTSKMYVKMIKGRRVKANTSWTMAIDFSKCMVKDTEQTEGIGE